MAASTQRLLRGHGKVADRLPHNYYDPCDAGTWSTPKTNFDPAEHQGPAQRVLPDRGPAKVLRVVAGPPLCGETKRPVTFASDS